MKKISTLLKSTHQLKSDYDGIEVLSVEMGIGKTQVLK